MSKKLIAVASAAALALTALVATPAAANYTFAVTPTGQLSTAAGLNDSAPLVINVPSQDVMRLDEATPADNDRADQSDTASVIRLNIQTTTTSGAVRVTTTGAVKLLSETQWSATGTRKTADGVTSLDLTSQVDTGKVNVYVYTTSTATGSVVITNGGNSRTVYVAGVNDITYGYNILFTAPTTADVSGTIVLSGSITDAFGNKITGLTANPFLAPTAPFAAATTFGAAGTLVATGSTGGWEESTTKGNYTFSVNTSATAGQGAVGLSGTITKVTALGDPKSSVFLTFNTASLADQIKLLQAEVAALQAKVDAKVTKKRFNRLARKWNAQNPNDKVKLKK